MAYAKIYVKEIKPLSDDNSISTETVFSFKLTPYDGDTINTSTLSIRVTINGSMGQRIVTLTDASPEITLTASGDSYKVEIDMDPDNPVNFNSGDQITLQVDVQNSIGDSMKRFTTGYGVVNESQLEAFIDLTSTFTEVTSNFEPGRLTIDGAKANFTWKNWVNTFTPEIYKNGMLIDSGYTVNYTDGYLNFNPSLSTGFNKTDSFNSSLYEPGDIINANYKYSCFSVKELISFMKIGLAEFNANYPASQFNITSNDPFAKAAALIGGSYYLYNAVVSGFINQQWRVQWGEDNWKDSVDIAKTMKENTKGVFEKIKESKRHRLAQGTIGIIVPEFSLTGGRSRFFSYLYGSGGTF